MFKYCLNTGTIRGQKLRFVEELEFASRAGYDSVEPWMQQVHGYRNAGGTLRELGQKIADLGLAVESAIGFGKWASDDATERAAGLEEVRRDLAALAEIGGKRLACPPVGATSSPIALERLQERYVEVLKIGDQHGVVPLLELWGFSANLHRVDQVMKVVLGTEHPKAAVVLDVYHIYKGGGNYVPLRLLSKNAMPVLHINDYPADPPRDKIGDGDRVYPGDGIAPLKSILKDVAANGGTVLSLELFNRSYWAQDALTVCKTGLAKVKAAVESAKL